jgi:2-polyprenyl-3-methyl-5-hydroxy-6-metoxy-1,4-benzoquinol methylase
MKVKVRLENNYQLFIDILPKKGSILDIGCGYGFLPYMLAYTSPERVVTGIDYDEEKISIAQNCFDKNANTNFQHVDVMKYDFPTQDAIILNDVLHYLTDDDQVTLLEKCISRLNDSGMIVIRDGVRELEKRHKGTRLTELFSTRILGFNKTASHGLHFISSQLIESVANRHHLSLSKVDTTKLTSNIIFVLKKRA